MPAFSAYKALGGYGITQFVTVGAQANYVLLSDVNFTKLNKHQRIIVTVTGNITSSSTTTDAFVVGDLSTYFNVDIINDATIRGKGGNGGVGESSGGAGPAVGGPGGDALFIDGANSSLILSFVNNTALRGGGGGGGGGARTSVGSFTLNAKDDCISAGTAFAASGGGGGGAGQNIGTGGAGGTGGTTSAAAGAAGTSNGGGAGGNRGTQNYTTSGQCNPATLNGNLGGNGGGSGLVGSVGPGGGSAGGARGFYIRNSGSCAFTNNGTVLGNSS